jgi:hypothetical protein
VILNLMIFIIARGLNGLWTKGGLQYGLPVR